MNQWLVIHTKAGREWMAYKNLMFQGFSPLHLHYNDKRRIGNGRYIEVKRPYMPRYVLARTDPCNLYAINNTLGVATALYTVRGPMIVPDEVVEELIMNAKADESGVVPLPGPENRRLFEHGEQVRITSGPLMGFLAVVQVDGGDKVKCWVSMFGQDTDATLDPGDLEAMG